MEPKKQSATSAVTQARVLAKQRTIWAPATSNAPRLRNAATVWAGSSIAVTVGWAKAGSGWGAGDAGVGLRLPLGVSSWITCEIAAPEGLFPPQLVGLLFSFGGMIAGSLLPQRVRAPETVSA